MGISRRDFLKYGLCVAASPQFDASASGHPYCPATPSQQAFFFYSSKNGNVTCGLCHHSCVVIPEGMGRCGTRVNRDGVLYALTYARPVAIHTDPIDKMPLRHVLPGERALCVGTAGCTFSCLYCINSHITQKPFQDVESFSRTPGEIVDMAIASKLPAIAFTYNEPTVAYEFMVEVFSVAKKSGLKTFFHTNGYIKSKPIKALLKITDAVVVDLKAYQTGTYKQLTNGNDKTVKETIKLIYGEGCFLEIVNLLVPGYNDSPVEMESLCNFMSDELSKDVPLHFSRFFPKFRLSHLPPTPTATINQAIGIARGSGLRFVYANNISIPNDDTRCPGCGTMLVERQGLRPPRLSINNGCCPKCGYKVPGIWRT
jgi:pyruvate formate lyase activating enzyme